MRVCVCVWGGEGGGRTSKAANRVGAYGVNQEQMPRKTRERERSRGGKQQFTGTTTEMQSRTHVYVDKRDRHFWIKPALEGGEEKYTA